jgi:hypothetical protein
MTTTAQIQETHSRTRCNGDGHHIDLHMEHAIKPNDVVALIRDQLEQHPHFRSRTTRIQIETVGNAVILSGRLPTYYLKQLLQEAVKTIPDVASIDKIDYAHSLTRQYKRLQPVLWHKSVASVIGRCRK